ncbi:WD40/YVTN/BNR-like repeat-containing protein [Paractinoplanes globisporus]|uniref:Sialidase family protein n=1 Tax=Paractinoplanes globisporus TaxID=113565 RepID=A0ABW6WVC6_9ACTN|nr:sialidase family protein [Actinoplanes globisporus]
MAYDLEALTEAFEPGVSAAGVPTPRASTHKLRSAWFQARESWPLREAPVRLLTRERARAAVELTAAGTAHEWSFMGPANVGGRMTCAVHHPTEADRLWAGAAGGGVWHSPDGGLTWSAQWHDEPTLNVGALAFDPDNPDVLYCGTGEANLSADSHPGVGLMRTLDAGASWNLLASAEAAGLPTRIGAVAVDPFDPRHLLVGGVRHAPGTPTGLFASTDGGASWAFVPIAGAGAFFCHDIRFTPHQRGLVLATITARGMQSGIWRSRDGGLGWEQLRGGLPAPDRINRTSLAMAPSDPDVIYAQMATPDPTDPNVSRVLGVFRTEDGGDNWRSIGGQHFAEERQMTYGNTIVVHPEDPNLVLCGGVDLHRTRDGGGHWEQVTRWNDKRGTPTYAHADHHALLMPASRPGVVYDFNDGGMDRSGDSGSTWQNRSSGLATNMFYDLEVAQTDGNFIAGGAQDNGTAVTVDGKPDTYFPIPPGGDGGWVVIDTQDAGRLFSSCQGMVVFRFRGGDPAGQRWKDVSPPEQQFKMWMVFLSLDGRHRGTLFTGSRRVWRTDDDGDTWQAVSAPLDGSDITAVEVARADRNRIYVGTENGGFFRSVDRGETWSGNLASTVLPGFLITRLQSRADNAEIVYATVANFGSRHVFRSIDGGETWTDVDRGNLPDAPVHSIALPADRPGRVYVCGDAGVFVTDDEDTGWSNLTGNLPNVMVVDLVYHERDHTLTAATYGRGIWRLQVD